MDDIEFRLLSSANIAIAEKFLKEEFYPREPSAAHLEITPKEMWAYDKAAVELALVSGVSIGAFDKNNGSICGISLNLLGRKQEPDPDNTQQHPLGVNQLFEMLKQLTPNGLAAEVGTTNYLEIFLLGVKQGLGKRGLGTKLCKRGIETARQQSCQFVTAICSGALSRKVFLNLGLKTIREIVYNDYVDPLTGKYVFKEMRRPHYACTLVLMKL